MATKITFDALICMVCVMLPAQFCFILIFCSRFLEKYQDSGESNQEMEMSLDVIAKDLSEN